MTGSLGGVLVPLTTPFDEATGDVAPVALRDNARRMVEEGIDGFVVAGSTGEAAMLSEEESRSCTAWLRDVLPDSSQLIVGAGRESTRATIAACRWSGEEGADAVLVRAPSYYSSSIGAGDLVDHFRRIADASPVPVLVYNIPKYTHLAIGPAEIEILAEHPNITGGKDSSGDIRNLAAYRDAAPAWQLFVGSGALLYAALELGAAGGIVGVGNFAPSLSAEVYRSFQAGDRARSGEVQERLAELHKAIVAALGPAGVKHAMDLVGLTGGPPRPPVSALSAAQEAAVATALREGAVVG